MPKKHSSPRKPVKKASTRNRSTTSTTTARKTRADSPETVEATNTAPVRQSETDPTEASEPYQFSPELQAQYLQLLARGASPAAACMQLNLPVMSVLNQITTDATFRARLDQIHDVLSQNVAAALYRSAMEGSVSAQTFFLKNCPPPEWPGNEPVPAAMNDGLDELTDDELAQLCRDENILA